MLSLERLATVALATAPVQPYVRQATAELVEIVRAARAKAGGRPVLIPLARAVSAERRTAAATVAHELRLPLFRLDLRAVVSKYIGETEKQLGALFARAEASGGALLFDDADALFGKRTSVGTNPSSAPADAAHLLATWLDRTPPALVFVGVANEAVIDPAFLRRFQHVVRFPLPAPGLRAATWASVLPTRR